LPDKRNTIDKSSGAIRGFLFERNRHSSEQHASEIPALPGKIITAKKLLCPQEQLKTTNTKKPPALPEVKYLIS
jgi:hypothetical protein